MKVDLLPNDFGNTQIEIETNYGHKFVQTNTKDESRATQFLAIRNKKTNKVIFFHTKKKLTFYNFMIIPLYVFFL